MHTRKNLTLRNVAALLLVAGMLFGCAGTPAKIETGATADPIEPANRLFFGFNETLDQLLVKPIAQGYVDITPARVRTAVTNFFDNLSYLNTIVNSFLQGKFVQSFSDVGRFIVNSTFGVGGLFDVATGMGLKQHDEDFGQTLAVWGAGQGAYVYLPIRGPNTVRDLPDQVTGYFLNPLTYVSGTVLFPIVALSIINRRANLLEATNIRDEAAVDKYTFTREAYIQRREYLIFDGNPPSAGYEDIFNDQSDDSVLIIQ